jgi:hypothetical protein
MRDFRAGMSCIVGAFWWLSEEEDGIVHLLLEVPAEHIARRGWARLTLRLVTCTSLCLASIQPHLREMTRSA